MNPEREKEILKFLEYLRYYVNMDGGDMEFIKIEKKIIYLRPTGGCVNCALIDLTFRETVAQILLQEFPEDLEGVELVNLN